MPVFAPLPYSPHTEIILEPDITWRKDIGLGLTDVRRLGWKTLMNPPTKIHLRGDLPEDRMILTRDSQREDRGFWSYLSADGRLEVRVNFVEVT